MRKSWEPERWAFSCPLKYMLINYQYYHHVAFQESTYGWLAIDRLETLEDLEIAELVIIWHS